MTLSATPTMTAPAAAGAPGRTARPQAGLPLAIRAEWTKLRSLRSTWWTLGSTVVVTALVTFLVSRSTTGHTKDWYQGFDPTNQALAGLFFASLVVGVFGALAITGEYGTGTMRASLAAVPRRGVLYAAKAIVVGALTLVVGECLAFLSFFEGQAVLSGGAPTASLGQPGVLRAVVLSGACLALLALIAFGIGTAVRHTAGAITVYAGFTILFAVVAMKLSQEISRFAPEVIFASSIGAVVPQPRTLSATIGFVMMCVYAAVALGIGAIALFRRDA